MNTLLNKSETILTMVGIVAIVLLAIFGEGELAKIALYSIVGIVSPYVVSRGIAKFGQDSTRIS
jgi:preprotein translocase subunit SecF